ncbi:glycosyltransferase [Exiguobacterium sp. SH0S1]|uniref:glycosyltransferase family 4 protein n=1 Tax=Exiguobacterium sp. SH0S1 TaxID=2510949 RepID=UPI0010393A70|nr:glycosyltransferase family 4 protein [Exiguobacterium sp. SH0S1]TCI77793.1 glycosyltransferase [Exiguobacterium sp. SH0S1]
MERRVDLVGRTVKRRFSQEGDLEFMKTDPATVVHGFEKIPQSGLRWLAVTFDASVDPRLSVRFLLEQMTSDDVTRTTVVEPGKTNWVAIDRDTVQVKLHYRLSGEGVLRVSPLRLRGETESEPFTVPEADTLVISTAYPHASHLYRHGFIHTRLREYVRQGVRPLVHIVRTEDDVVRTYTHEGIDVIEAAPRFGEWIARASGATSLLIHFLNETIYEMTRSYQPRIPTIVWIHGVETEAWYRRWFQFLDNADDLRHALELKTRKEQQLGLMSRLYRGDDPYVSFVHVSDWFKTRVAEVDAKQVTERSTTIPNPIDDRHFRYQPKDGDARFHVLSIRPYHTTKYGNDLAVAAVLRLQDEPWFEDVTFSFYGDGPLFGETLAPVRELPNVIVKQQFLTSDEIYALHQENGIFLCPTRLDSQGVSMCEAMSSGLVPVTNDVAAIAEFVEDGVSGLLARSEDVEGLADHLKTLIENEGRFLQLSAEASRHIQDRCGIDRVVRDEIAWISTMSSSCN